MLTKLKMTQTLGGLLPPVSDQVWRQVRAQTETQAWQRTDDKVWGKVGRQLRVQVDSLGLASVRHILRPELIRRGRRLDAY